MSQFNYRRLLAVLLVLMLALPAFTAVAQDGYSAADNFRTWSLDAYEAETGNSIGMFNEAPMLADMVAAGDLPPVEERLPDRGDIMVVQPREAIGTYGGEITFNATNPTSFGNTGFTAWDQHLTGFSTNWEVVFPEVAKSVELSDDLLTATVTLRSGMKWSDGTPVTADDVMFWYEDIMLHPDLPNMSNALRPGGTPLVVEKVDDNDCQLRCRAAKSRLPDCGSAQRPRLPAGAAPLPGKLARRL